MLLTSRKFLTFYLNFYKLNPVLRYLNKHDCSPWPSAATLTNLTSNMLKFPVRYAQIQPKVYPSYTHKYSKHALRVKSNLEAKHTISVHRSLSKPLPVKIWTSIGKLPQFNTDLIMIDHDWPITILTTICKNCSKIS